MDAWSRVDYPRMFAGLIGMAVLGVGIYEVLALVERLLTPWRRA